jgi:pilus assembly protein Flp/PilA
MNNLLLKLSFKLRDLASHDEGQDMVQYAMICALLAFGIVSGMTVMARSLNTAFDNISANLVNSTS